MPIPDFQSIMLPLLKFLSDSEEHTNQEAVDSLAVEFGLSEEDLGEMLPSGTQPVFVNRFGWAKSHMKMAGLVEAPHRADIKITDRDGCLVSLYDFALPHPSLEIG